MLSADDLGLMIETFHPRVASPVARDVAVVGVFVVGLIRATLILFGWSFMTHVLNFLDLNLPKTD